jgi:hypothetical protein
MNRELGYLLVIKAVVAGGVIVFAKMLVGCIQSMPLHRGF